MTRYLNFTSYLLTALLTAISLTALSQSKPNVLFIVVDDLRPALGCYGDSYASSPHIDQLAAQGMLFTEAYCQQAVCAPSRASFMTGKKPDHTKVWNLDTHFRKALPEVVTLPQYFKNNGYYTRQIGKIYHDPKSAQDPRSWSVAELFAITTHQGKYALDSNLAHAPKATATEMANVADETYIDGLVAAAAVKELKTIGKSPFFLAVGFRRPHLPFSAPNTYWAKYEGKKVPLPSNAGKVLSAPKFSWHNSVELRGYSDIPDFGEIDEELSAKLIQGYYTSISFVDEQIGKVLQELKRSGLDKNTIVVLLSDHGFHLGEHGLWGKTTNSKLDTQVPLIISVPSQAKGTGVSNEVVQLVDLYVTLSDLCGLPLPATDGKSFANVLKGKPYSGRGMAFSQFPSEMKYEDRPKVMGYAVHTERFGYVEWIDLKTNAIVGRELYDYQVDPAENKNLFTNQKYKSAMVKLSEAIQSYRK